MDHIIGTGHYQIVIPTYAALLLLKLKIFPSKHTFSSF